jgi:hypothetical protein
MRTLRLSLVGVVTLALLGGLGGAAMAQEEEQTATHVTGRVVSGEWSDPRLPPMMTGRMNLDAHWRETDAILPWASTHRLDGPDGAWTVTERGFMEADGAFALLVLTGEGAYEGLSAMLVEVVLEAYTGDDETILEGYIFEGGLPPLPDPIAPPAE